MDKLYKDFITFSTRNKNTIIYTFVTILLFFVLLYILQQYTNNRQINNNNFILTNEESKYIHPNFNNEFIVSNEESKYTHPNFNNKYNYNDISSEERDIFSSKHSYNCPNDLKYKKILSHKIVNPFDNPDLENSRLNQLYNT